jgi:hypothetical protein
VIERPVVHVREVIMVELLSRRSAMLAVPVTTAAALVASETTAAAAEPNIMTFTGRRTKTTLPNLLPVAPALGTTFICYLTLLDKDGKNIGDGSVNGAIVDIIPEVPPKLVCQVHVIFRFEQGEIHTSNMHVRLIPNPGVKHLIAVTGGTGDYRTARGSGTIEHVNDTDTLVVLNVMVDPPPATP